MPANPHQCGLYASRFFALAKNARSWEPRQIFAEMAETWSRRRGGIRSNGVTGNF